MRKHRYIRGGYAGSVKKSRKKLIIRIAFVIGCALALTVFAVLLGSYLNGKAEESKALSTQTESAEKASEDISELFPDGVPVKDKDEAKREICGADIDITSADRNTLCKMIDGLSAEYNAVSIRICGGDGKLVYISPALMEYVGLDYNFANPSDEGNGSTNIDITGDENDENNESGENTDDGKNEEDSPKVYDAYENLCAVISKAKEKNLRVVVLYNADSSCLDWTASALSECEKDSVIAGELAALGCDELLIDGLCADEGQIPHDTPKAIVRYLAVLRSRSGDLLIGLNFPDNVYLIPQNASIIKTLSEYADFLAISIGTSVTNADEAYSAVYDNCYSLKGNFTMYNLRGIIVSDNADIACAIHASLKALSAKSFQFTVYVADPKFTLNNETTDTDSADETGAVNDNANRKEDYLVSETESNVDPESIE